MFENTTLDAIAAYHNDCNDSLQLLFSSSNPDYEDRFFGRAVRDVEEEFGNRLSETETRSTLAVLARMEATFRLDYKKRARRKLPDNISIEFRKIWKRQAERAALHQLFDVWKSNSDIKYKNLIGQLGKAFEYRHWIAHGRYWQFTTRFDYDGIYTMAETLLDELPWEI